MHPISRLNPIQHIVDSRKPTGPDTPPLAPETAIDAIQDTLDLSSTSRNLPETFRALSPEEQSAYLKSLARLLHAGVVGTETLEVRGKPYQSFASNRFADRTIAHAKTLQQP